MGPKGEVSFQHIQLQPTIERNHSSMSGANTSGHHRKNAQTLTHIEKINNNRNTESAMSRFKQQRAGPSTSTSGQFNVSNPGENNKHYQTLAAGQMTIKTGPSNGVQDSCTITVPAL